MRFSGNLGPCVAAKHQQGRCKKGAVQRRGLCGALSQKASLGAVVTGKAAELSVAGVGLWKVKGMFMDPESCGVSQEELVIVYSVSRTKGQGPLTQGPV